jgi:hypothetical protein
MSWCSSAKARGVAVMVIYPAAMQQVVRHRHDSRNTIIAAKKFLPTSESLLVHRKYSTLLHPRNFFHAVSRTVRRSWAVVKFLDMDVRPSDLPYYGLSHPHQFGRAPAHCLGLNSKPFPTAQPCARFSFFNAICGQASTDWPLPPAYECAGRHCGSWRSKRYLRNIRERGIRRYVGTYDVAEAMNLTRGNTIFGE